MEQELRPESSIGIKNRTSKSLVDRFISVRNWTTEICKSLEIEDYVAQPRPEVSPPKWHLGHTTWFFEELILKKHVPEYSRFNENFPLLFNSYYKSAGEHWKQCDRGQLSRPTVREIIEYRNHVDRAMTRFLGEPQINSDAEFALVAGLHHEQQHQELLLMDIKNILATNPTSPAYSTTPLPQASKTEISWANFDEKIYQVGFGEEGFSYDNEGPRHKTYIQNFSMRNNLVSNGEYLEFIEDSAYTNPEYWLSLGWDWACDHSEKHPLYWRQVQGEWHEYTLHGLVPLDLNAPLLHISFFEADAFANWKGLRLPTEFEMEMYLDDNRPSVEHMPDSFHPLHCGRSQGQVWCWTQSHYSRYPGFRKFKGMLGEYNGKFMCNQFVLKGGCFATPPGHYRNSYRNFYLPEQRWMFSGVRLAKDGH